MKYHHLYNNIYTGMFNLQRLQVDELFEYSSLKSWYISAWQMAIYTKNKKMHKCRSVAHVDSQTDVQHGPKTSSQNYLLNLLQYVRFETPVPLFTAGDYDYFQVK